MLKAFHTLMSDPLQFIERMNGLRLRAYQRAAAQAIADSVIGRRGLSFVVMFPRQSGKNELQAQLEVYLLSLLLTTPAEIVKISPTWKPQSLNAMRRLERVLERCPFTRDLWSKENGYVYRVGDARIFFLSGAPEANIVGATASTLLEVDEAQDVSTAKFDRDVAPMAASTNATRVFWGTAWTAQTLLARELRAARAAERADGLRRAFVLTADDVAREVPDYGRFVAGQVARLGRSHPMVRTQFFSEEIDAEGGMFPPDRLARMIDPHAPAHPPHPLPGKVYAFLLDVAGEEMNEEAGAPANPRRDATALTIVEVDLATLADPVLRAPTYRPAARHSWTGTGHTQLYGAIRALAETWQPRHIVVDATGVGAGLAAFLARAFPNRVVRFLFNQASKSKLGWDFLNVVEEGRWREGRFGAQALGEEALRRSGDVGGEIWRVGDQEDSSLPNRLSAWVPDCPFFTQLHHTQYELLPGPGRGMKWGVPDGTRDPATGGPVHDDWVMSAALCTLLDGQPWGAPGMAGPGIVRGIDPLEEMRGF